MSKINYSGMSKTPQPVPEKSTQAVVADANDEAKTQNVQVVESDELETTAEEQKNAEQELEPKTEVRGVVSGCVRLNVRKYPNKISEVVRIIDAGEEVTVDMDDSTGDWYKVRIYKVADLHGYCMKKFITIKK